MKETLEQSLAAVFGEDGAAGQTADRQPVAVGNAQGLADSMVETFERSQTALTQRNWQSYGKAQRSLESFIQQLDQQIRAAPHSE